MVEITAQYFAVFRERAGRDREVLATRSNTAVALFAEVSKRHGFRDSAASCKVAINGEMVRWDTPLASGDVVLFFPPVAGG
ncbi:MAG TPA: MoaD/ThiS family protein [Gammaproteobacteria bacterium]|jgi:molybdopterin converting factor small subunit